MSIPTNTFIRPLVHSSVHWLTPFLLTHIFTKQEEERGSQYDRERKGEVLWGPGADVKVCRTQSQGYGRLTKAEMG